MSRCRTPLDPAHKGFRRDSSFNDGWLAQEWVGGWVAVTGDRRLWLGRRDVF